MSVRRRQRRQRLAFLLREERLEHVLARSARRPIRGCRARRTRCRQSADGRAARRTRRSRGRARPFARRRLAPVSDTTCAVPVLPDTSLPSMRARPPVPAPLTTSQRPSRTACRSSWLSETLARGAGGGIALPALAIRIDRAHQVRRHERAAIGDGRDHRRQRDRRDGHGALADRDGNRLARIPGLLNSRCFHSVDGTRLSASPGKSMPVLPTRPSFVA